MPAPAASSPRVSQPPVPFPPQPTRDPGLPEVHVHAPMVFVPPAFEYRHLRRELAGDAALGEPELNELGRDGWELVGVVAEPGAAHYYFKRETR